MKKVLALFTVPLTLASTFFPVLAEEEEENYTYIKIDIPYYSYAAYNYWISNGFDQFYYPIDEQGDPLYNSSGISASETINITSNQANSTYTETDSYNLTTTDSGNIKGSLYAQAVTGSGGTTNYNITTGAGAAVANLPYTGTGTIKGSVTETGTLTNGNITSTGNSSITAINDSQIVYNYELPWLTGAYTHSSSYNSTSAIFIDRGYSAYISFYTNKSLNSPGSTLNMLNYYIDPSNPGTLEFNRNYFVGQNFCFYTIKITCTDATNVTCRVSIDFPKINSDVKIIPLYIGNGTDLTDEDKTRFGIETNLQNTIISESDQTQTLMNTGTNTSQTSENNVNTTNNILRNNVNNLETYESGFNTDLNNSLNNITLPNISGIAKFGNAARWVSLQFTRLTTDERINFPLIFCLTLGLALTILGRIRT